MFIMKARYIGCESLIDFAKIFVQSLPQVRAARATLRNKMNFDVLVPGLLFPAINVTHFAPSPFIISQ